MPEIAFETAVRFGREATSLGKCGCACARPVRLAGPTPGHSRQGRLAARRSNGLSSRGSWGAGPVGRSGAGVSRKASVDGRIRAEPEVNQAFGPTSCGSSPRCSPSARPPRPSSDPRHNEVATRDVVWRAGSKARARGRSDRSGTPFGSRVDRRRRDRRRDPRRIAGGASRCSGERRRERATARDGRPRVDGRRRRRAPLGRRLLPPPRRARVSGRSGSAARPSLRRERLPIARGSNAAEPLSRPSRRSRILPSRPRARCETLTSCTFVRLRTEEPTAELLSMSRAVVRLQPGRTRSFRRRSLAVR
jgi:hypothetical protein